MFAHVSAPCAASKVFSFGVFLVLPSRRARSLCRVLGVFVVMCPWCHVLGVFVALWVCLAFRVHGRLF